MEKAGSIFKFKFKILDIRMSIRRKLILALLSLLVVIITVFTAYFYFLESHTIRSEIVKRGNAVTKIFTQMAATYIFEMDYATVLDNANELVESGDVASVAVIDLRGRPLTDTRGLGKGPYVLDEFYQEAILSKTRNHRQIRKEKENFLEFVHPVTSVGKTICLLKMDISLKAAEDRLIEVAKKTVILSVCLIAAALILAVFLSKLLADPIKKLLRGTHEISGGNLDYRIEIRSQDEIGELAYNFNRMSKSLKEQIARLRKAEEKYRSIFENAVEGLFQIGADGSFISANPSLARIMGFSSPEQLLVLPNSLDQHYTNPDDPDMLRQILLSKERVSGFEALLRRRNGSVFLASLSVRAVLDSQGRLLCYEGSLVDTTEHDEEAQKELEASFRAHLSLTQAHEKLETQNATLIKANGKIMDSIRYARMIQTSILTPNLNILETIFPESFILWMPKDVVSGDFIFSHVFEDGVLIVVADCTGHGVPGALMTMIVSSGLTKIVKDGECRNPAQILGKLNAFVKTSLHQDTRDALSDDGLDAAICFIRPPFSGQGKGEKDDFGSVVFAGARLPLFYIIKDEVFFIRGDRKSIGYKRSDLNFVFSNHTVPVQEKTAFYMLTDGFSDQLGGKKRYGFGRNRFISLLKTSGKKPFEKQKDVFLHAFKDYKGEEERQDDVTVVGFGCG